MVELLRPIFTNLYLKFSDLKFAYIPPPNDKILSMNTFLD